MKKFIALSLMLAMVSTFAACGQQTSAPAESSKPQTSEVSVTNDLTFAKEYLASMYRKAPSTHVEDFEVVGKVKVGETSYDVEWTADSDTVKIVKGDNNMVKIDIDEKNPEEVHFKLTGTLTDANGNKETVEFDKKVPAAIILDAGMSYEEIVEAAYKLEDGLDLGDEYRLFGKIIEIKDEYNEKYKNITLTIQIGDLSDKPIVCFRMGGEGVDKLVVGDEITVNGLLKNYKGTIEFDKGCQFIGLGEKKDQSAIVEAAYKLEDGIAMTEEVTLTGVVTEIKDAFNEKYNNITVIIEVDGIADKPIMCFRMSGEGADTLEVGNEITVTGIIKNFKGTVEFDKGCTLDAIK